LLEEELKNLGISNLDELILAILILAANEVEDITDKIN
jgi:hypothetical protein